MTRPGTGRGNPPAALRLRLLGALELERTVSQDRLALQPKRLALLGYLAAAGPGTFHRRDTLVGLFWPELDAEHARGALNKAVHYLRRGVGDVVIVSRGDEDLGLDPARIWCDVAAFQAARASHDPAEALLHYGGDLMPGLFLSDAPEWEKWLDARRLALREQALDAAWSLATSAENAGQPVEAGSWARRALGLAPDDETIVRRGIELLDRIGDRAGALRAYDDFARRLADGYEIDPAPETVALIARVRTSNTPDAEASTPLSLSSTTTAARDIVAAEARVAPASAVDAGIPEAEALHAVEEPLRRGRLPVVALVTLVAVAVAIAAWVVEAQRNAKGTEMLSPRRVVVAPLDNRTGDPAFDVVGQMAADWVIHGLSQSGTIELVPVTAMLTSVRYVLTMPDANDSAARLAAIARETGAGITISGSYYLQGDSLYFSARVTDVVAGKVLLSLDPISTAPDALLAAIETLRGRILAGLAPLLDPRMADYARIASRPPSFDAYRAYAEGMNRFLVADWRGAVTHFSTAAAADSSYTLPLVLQAIAYANLGQYARVDSLVTLLAPRRDRLPEYDRLAITAAAAWARGDYATSYQAAVRVGELAPNTIGHAQVAAEALALNRPREARDLLRSLDPNRGELRGWIVYWVELGKAHHALGAYQRELQVARETVAQHPSSPAAMALELRALAGLGRDAEVLAAARNLLETPDRPFAGSVLQQAAVELRAHSRAAAARQLPALLLKWQRQQPATTTPGARRLRATTQ
ncbi:hypothetical protein BH23GEM9_BH23GEM9_26040 [soil metagenome]